MFITSITGVTEKRDIQIQRSCEKIYIVQKAGAAALLERVEATLTRVRTEGRNVNQIQKDNLGMISEYATAGEGAFAHNSAAVELFPGVMGFCVIPVGAGGAADLDGGDYLSLDLEKLTSAATYEVYAVEGEDIDAPSVIFEQNAVAAPAPIKKMANTGYNTILLPITNFDKIELYYERSSKSKQSVELGIDHFLQNDVVSYAVPVGGAHVPKAGFRNFYVCSLEGVTNFDVHTSSVVGYDFWLVRVQE